MVEIPALVLSLAVLVFPGVLLSYALLRGFALSRLERALVGAAVSVALIPTLEVLEFVFFGAKMSAMLVFANCIFVSVAAFALLAHQRAIPTSFPSFRFQLDSFDWQRHKGIVVAVLLVFILLFAFWARFSTSWAHNFFEFDPIFYSHVTEILVKNGAVPVETDEVYYPHTKFLRIYPLVAYLGASLYSVYDLFVGGEFYKVDFSLVLQVYPPLVGMLLVFLIYLLFKEESNPYVGLIAAGTAATMPQLIVKFGAGVNELQPWGLFSAVMVFVFTVLAVSRRSYRFALIAGMASFSAVIGSAQAVWPLATVAVVVFLHSLVSFWRGELDGRMLAVYAASILPAFVAGFVMTIYQGNAISLTEIGTTQQLLFGALAASLLFYCLELLAKRMTRAQPAEARKRILGGILAATIVLSILLPAIPGKIFDFVNSTAGFSRQFSALGMTVAEENPTTPNLYFGAFGHLNPDVVLAVLAMLVAAYAIVKLWIGGRRNAALGLLAATVAISVLNPVVDYVLLALTHTFLSGYSTLASFITGSDVFAYMILAVVSTLTVMLLADEKISPKLLLLVIMVFPVAYIGLNKLKFMPHLSLALAFAFPFLLMLVLEIVKSLSALLPMDSDKEFARKAALFLVLAGGVLLLYGQYALVQNSMQSLQFTRISGDWMGAYEWMRTTPSMARPVCESEYGYDCRVLSWWDYGHWTTYFGEKKSVLDPGNAYHEFDQEVARAFVHGRIGDLLYTVRFHRATHVLVDAELISKWGALVFLSGSCNANQSPTCPAAPEIDFKGGAGRSTYEAEHYFEFLNNAGQCPAQLTGVALPAFRSSLTNAVYCFTDGEYLLLTQNGLQPSYKRKYKIVGRDAVDANNLDQNTSYLFAYSADSLININPDLTYVGIVNNVFNSAFTRLFFFETLPGFELAHRSPTGEVKIFKITKDFIAGKTVGQVSSPSSAPQPTPAPAATPSPAPEPAGQNSTQANSTGAGGANGTTAAANTSANSS